MEVGATVALWIPQFNATIRGCRKLVGAYMVGDTQNQGDFEKIESNTKEKIYY